ncbi:MAG: adenine phosphoribosyltransferase, partial [Akkermansiaceae bacterium]
FKDISHILSDPHLLRKSIELLTATAGGDKIDKVVGIDARGFIFAAPVALDLDAGFVPVRKQGKLPWETHQMAYSLEYGENVVEIHKDAIFPGENVLLVDDLLATGGTAAAAIKLIRQLDANLVGVSFLIELADLNGRELLGDIPVNTILKY